MEAFTQCSKGLALGVIVLLAQAQADRPPVILSPMQMMLLAAGMSLLGGLAASLRNEPVTVKHSITIMLNTSILGASIAMIGYAFVANSPIKIWLVVGVATLASLGGLSMLDSAVQIVKSKINQWINHNGN